MNEETRTTFAYDRAGSCETCGQIVYAPTEQPVGAKLPRLSTCRCPGGPRLARTPTASARTEANRVAAREAIRAASLTKGGR